MHRKIHIRVFLLVSVFWAYCSYSSPVDDMNSLIQQKKFSEAYELGVAHAPTQEGETQFDFLIGLAALESNHIPESVFALERVILRNPNNVRARFELGRAYYRIKHFDLSRSSFDIVLSSSPADSLRRWTEHYLDLIEHGEQLEHPFQVRLHAGLASGYSSNINTGPNFDFVLIPVGNLQRPSEVPLGIADGFVNGDVAAEIRYRWNDQSQLRTRLMVDYRKNFQSLNYDYQTIGLNNKLEFQKSRWHFTVPVNVTALLVNYQMYRWVFDLGGKVGFDLNQENRLSLGGVFDFSYFPFEPSLNATNLNFALTWELWVKNFELVLSTYSDWVFPIFKQQAYLSKDFFGSTFAALYHPVQNHAFIFAMKAEHSLYKDINIQYTVKREEWLINPVFAWRWTFVPNLSFQPSYSLVKSFSNIVEYEHIRHEIQCGLIWDMTL